MSATPMMTRPPGPHTCMFTARAPTATGLMSTVQMAKHHPRDEHWYLYAIGVDPPCQGQGQLYEHFGFEVTGPLNPPEGAPPLTAMWRYPGG